MRRRSGVALGLLLGMAADAVLGDPVRDHPVAAFDRAATAAERRMWADSRLRGALFVLASVGPLVAVAAGAQRWPLRRGPAAGVTAAGVTAAATWAVLGGTSLTAEALAIARLLEKGDLEGARRRLPALCGRDPEHLQEAGIARAVVESVAENTCDAVVAPLARGAACGPPGLIGLRAVNTLDAMVGHRSASYERFGWAAARVDDAAALVPARVTALLAVALASAVGGSARNGLRVLRRDGGNHPSPNSGRCEAAFAGVLGIRLGGTNVYNGRTERRGAMGEGPPPGPREIRRAVALSRLTGAAAAALAALATAALSGDALSGDALSGEGRR